MEEDVARDREAASRNRWDSPRRFAAQSGTEELQEQRPGFALQGE